MSKAKLDLQIRLSSRDLKDLRRCSGEGNEASVVEQAVHEWLVAHRMWGLGPPRPLDDLVGMFDGPAAPVAEEHDRHGMGAEP